MISQELVQLAYLIGVVALGIGTFFAVRHSA